MEFRYVRLVSNKIESKKIKGYIYIYIYIIQSIFAYVNDSIGPVHGLGTISFHIGWTK